MAREERKMEKERSYAVSSAQKKVAAMDKSVLMNIQGLTSEAIRPDALYVEEVDMASDCAKPKKPKTEQGSPGTSKGNWRDSPTKSTPGNTPGAGARRLEIPLMPGSSEDRKDDEKSVITESDPENNVSATLRRLMHNPSVS